MTPRQFLIEHVHTFRTTPDSYPPSPLGKPRFEDDGGELCSVAVALAFAGMLNSIGVDGQVYAPSLSSHWPSCMKEAAMWPVSNLPPFERGEWHLPSRHVAEAYAVATNVPAIRDVFEAAGVPLERLQGSRVGSTSAFTGPLPLGSPAISASTFIKDFNVLRFCYGSVYDCRRRTLAPRLHCGQRCDGGPPPLVSRRSPPRTRSLPRTKGPQIIRKQLRTRPAPHQADAAPGRRRSTAGGSL